MECRAKPGQLTNPVIEHALVPLPADVLTPSVEDLRQVFPGAKQSLKTWGRTPGVLNGVEPHWIGVHKQTPLHVDPMYPRYTHHLLLRVDDFALRGVDKVGCPLIRGSYVVVDTHSPHQLFARTKSAVWYLAVSMDSPVKLPRTEVLPALIRYAKTAPLLTDEIVRPNNGGRW